MQSHFILQHSHRVSLCRDVRYDSAPFILQILSFTFSLYYFFHARHHTPSSSPFLLISYLYFTLLLLALPSVLNSVTTGACDALADLGALLSLPASALLYFERSSRAILV